jgi:two-component system, cell cycle response regulator
MQSEARIAAQDPPTKDLNDSSITLLSDPARRCRVLLVDDDELVRAQFAALLQIAGYDVYTASSGDEALRVLDKTSCQIVLTDWQMPDMDGLALCRNIRLRDNTGYIYVLMLTIRSSRRDVLAGLSAGADDYVVKGAATEEILARLQVGRRITHLEYSLRQSNLENRQMSVTDPLTGARNRRYLMKYLPREIERARRYNHPLTILSCDIDHFKRINDGFGHDAGDEVLQAFVDRAGLCIRQAIDWMARAGGEEFVVVLPETPLAGGCHVAQRLLETLADNPIATCAGPLVITMSIGIASLDAQTDPENASATKLLSTADRYLYESKNLGRNRATAGPAVRMVAPTPNVTRKASDEIH